MGLLTPQGPQDWHPAPAVVREACATAVDLVERRRGQDIVRLAFQFSASHPDVASCLVGPTNAEHLLSSIKWMGDVYGGVSGHNNNREVLGPDPELLAEVQELLAPIRNRLWVEAGSEENIALASGGFWAEGHSAVNKIQGTSANLQS